MRRKTQAQAERDGSLKPSRTPLQHALALLARREHSRTELARKLRARGHDGAEVDAAIERLLAEGWQSDARFAEALVRHRAASGYGPRWIRAELATHAVSDTMIEAALTAFDGDWSEVALSLLDRRSLVPPPDVGTSLPPTRQRKAMELLLRRGFGREMVANLLRP